MIHLLYHHDNRYIQIRGKSKVECSSAGELAIVLDVLTQLFGMPKKQELLGNNVRYEFAEGRNDSKTRSE